MELRNGNFQVKIKFTGDFKKLIPMGFKFHKLFANNYKVYEKNGVWIWVSQGGYVEIDDHYDNSGYIAKRILDGTYPIYEENKDLGPFIIKKGEPRGCVINKKTGEISITADLIRSIGGYDNYDFDTYRDMYLNKKTMETIKEIEGMIEIEEDMPKL